MASPTPYSQVSLAESLVPEDVYENCKVKTVNKADSSFSLL